MESQAGTLMPLGVAGPRAFLDGLSRLQVAGNWTNQRRLSEPRSRAENDWGGGEVGHVDSSQQEKAEKMGQKNI